MYKSIAEIRHANERLGHYWFSRETMRFFNSRIESGVLKGRYFVSSEKAPDGVRAYTVRMALESGEVRRVGEFQQFKTLDEALQFIEEKLE